MDRRILYFIAPIAVISFLGGCNASLRQKEAPIFTSAEVEKRVAELSSEIESHPSDPNSHIELGKIFLSEGCIDASINEFEKALSINSEHVQAHLLLSLALQKHPRPNLSRAAQLLENAVRISPQNAEAHLNLAQVYGKLGKSENSIAEFKSAIELSDDPAILVSGHLGLMALYKKRGELDKADEEYDAAYQIYPGVEDMIKQAEISRITPPPKYAGEGFRDDESGLHPSLEKRIKQSREEIARISGEKNE